MTGCKSLLCNFRKCVGPNVTFGDDSQGRTEGYGVLSNGPLTFRRVSYVSGLKHNLISVSQLCDAGYEVRFRADRGTIHDLEGNIVLVAKRDNTLYTFDMSVPTLPKEVCFISRTQEELNWLWHKRLSHMNFKDINKLSKKELVSGLPVMKYEKDKLCSACEKGKQHKASFKSKTFSSIESPLDLLHMDLFGPVSTPSISGKKYTLVIVDEYSRFTWVFFLKAKSEAAEEIINFIKKAEIKYKTPVRQLRSDNGTEFKNVTLNSFCDEKGISQCYSAARTPQQNGVAERRNRTLIEAARSMIAQAGIHPWFWADAVHTACFTQNRSLIVKRHQMTAYEVLKGRKPEIGFLRMFGSPCFILNQKDHLGKFDEKSDDGIFLGYSTTMKAYRVYNKRTRIVDDSVNVKIDESPLNIASSDHEDEMFDFEELTIPQSEPSQADGAQSEGEQDVFEANIPVTQSESSTPHNPESNLPSDNQSNIPELPSVPVIQSDVESSVNNHSVDGHIRVTKWTRSHPPDQIIGNPHANVQTRRKATSNFCMYVNFVSKVEPTEVEEALSDPSWVSAMQEELTQFERNKVWNLVPCPPGKKIIGTKWIYRNKMDERGVVTRNKARLVA